MLSWKVMRFDCNDNRIEEYNLLQHRLDWLKKTKKKCKDKQEFAEKLDREMMYHYWSRAEYELILVKCNSELWLKPWVGSCNPEAAKVDVSKSTFWQEFSKIPSINWWDNETKIDIYDQLKFKWDEFVDYCWNTHLPYERRRKDNV